jgi:sensor histidine kinase YesM
VAAAGLLVGLAASLFLHEGPWGLTVLWAVGVSGLVTRVVRSSWAELPSFVTGWLDGGVFVVGVLFVVAMTGLTGGLPYFVLRWPRVLALLASAGLLATAVGGLAYTHQRLAIEVRAASDRLALAQQRALESRLATLSAQINPHFLFNTLNTLAEVVHEDEDQAEDLVTDLASMMRYVLDHSAKRVPLREEFDVVARLLRIEHARLGERLRFELDLDPGVAEVEVPGLLVQPLVENAVQHGVAGRVGGGTVRVSAHRRGDAVEIVVEDDGPGVPEGIRRHVHDPLDDDVHPGGLRNVAERARLGWPAGAAQLRIETEPSRVVLTLPAEEP